MQTNESYGILALGPPLLAIILCFITKRVLISLFAGVFLGATIISGWNPLAGVEYSLDSIIGSLTDEWNARLLLFNLLMGSGVAFIWRLGGSKALTNSVSKKVKTKRQAGLGAWTLGMVVFFNDYVNAAIVGNVFRDVFDRMKISREKLSYILDSTAAPVATFFISDWIAFQIGMIKSGMDAAGISGVSSFSAYLNSVPFNLYAIFAVLLVGIVIITKKDIGKMKNAEYRAETTGKVIRDGATPMLDVNNELGKERDKNPKLLSFFLPIVALVVVTLYGFYETGKAGKGLMGILAETDPAKALLWGGFAMAATGMVIALSRKIMNLKEIMETFIDGMKLMLLACAILVLAWSLGGITKDMGLAQYLIKLTGDSLDFTFLPVIIFFTGMITAFATGTSWGAMTILTPVAIPLTYQITGDVYISTAMAGVVFSGAIFGDHCSPISDTTVLASIFSGSDHMDHVITQLPYALLTAGTAFSGYLLFGFAGVSPFIIIPLGMIILIILLYLFSFIKEKQMTL
ncbi:MAG: sodium:proton antiporter [Melioribacteraceae bacterium]|nr:MAG: sodium:proton antiporter [Melioribacteraceae bacterium]